MSGKHTDSTDRTLGGLCLCQGNIQIPQIGHLVVYVYVTVTYDNIHDYPQRMRKELKFAIFFLVLAS